MASLEDESIFVILTSASVRPIKVHSVEWNQNWPGDMLLNSPTATDDISNDQADYVSKPLGPRHRLHVARVFP